MIDPTTIFKAVSLTKAIAQYLGFIDGISDDIKKLLHQSFKSAILNLEYAKGANSDFNRLEYVKSARDEFIRAITVEVNENLVSAYLGLAMCQFLLKDKENAIRTINRIKNVQLSQSERNIAIAEDISGIGGVKDNNPPILHPFAVLWRGGKRIIGTKGKNERIREYCLNLYKEEALKCLHVI